MSRNLGVLGLLHTPHLAEYRQWLCKVRWKVLTFAIGFGIVLPQLPQMSRQLLDAASELPLNLDDGVRKADVSSR